MSKKHDSFRLGILFTEEQTGRINQMAESGNFFELSEFVYNLVDKEYNKFVKQRKQIWDGDK